MWRANPDHSRWPASLVLPSVVKGWDCRRHGAKLWARRAEGRQRDQQDCSCSRGWRWPSAHPLQASVPLTVEGEARHLHGHRLGRRGRRLHHQHRPPDPAQVVHPVRRRHAAEAGGARTRVAGVGCWCWSLGGLTFAHQRTCRQHLNTAGIAGPCPPTRRAHLAENPKAALKPTGGPNTRAASSSCPSSAGVTTRAPTASIRSWSGLWTASVRTVVTQISTLARRSF